MTVEHNITITDDENNNITEQKYLELAQDFKNIMVEKDKLLCFLKNDLNDYKILVYKVLGITSFCYDLISNIELDDHGTTIEHNLEYINSQIMDLLHF